MNVGESLKHITRRGRGINFKLYEKNYTILDIYHDDINEKKDLILCEEEHGYRECFHRMDLEGANENRNTTKAT